MNDAQRGDFARQILDNPVYQEAMDAIASHLANQRAAVKLTDTQAITRLVECEQIMHSFRRAFEIMVQDGDAAKAEAELDAKRRRRPFAR